MKKIWTSLCALLSAAAAAEAQQVFGTNVTFELSWIEVVAGTTTPVLAPDQSVDQGESALIRLTISMTPPVNSPVTWNPVIGGSGSGTFRGLAWIFFDLLGSNGAAGTWSHLSVDEIWDLVGPPGYGTPSLGGASLINIQAGQFPQPWAVNTTNPIVNIWQAVWTPSSFEYRIVNFASVNGTANPSAFPASVLLRDPALPNVLVGTSAATMGSINIPISVPGPSALVCLALAAMWRAPRASRPLT